MKKTVFIIIMVFGLGTQLLAQNINTDFVALDFYCPNYEQLQAQYAGQSNAYIVTASEIKAPQQIATALAGKTVTDLHIFVNGKPGSMVFTSIGLTIENVDQYASDFAAWTSHVTGKVVVHNSEVFTANVGMTFKAKLEQLTGLPFVAQ
jgi:hypothetical protein